MLQCHTDHPAVRARVAAGACGWSGWSEAVGGAGMFSSLAGSVAGTTSVSWADRFIVCPTNLGFSKFFSPAGTIVAWCFRGFWLWVVGGGDG